MVADDGGGSQQSWVRRRTVAGLSAEDNDVGYDVGDNVGDDVGDDYGGVIDVDNVGFNGGQRLTTTLATTMAGGVLSMAAAMYDSEAVGSKRDATIK